MESACTMMAHAKLPKSYWGGAVATAAYVRNWLPTTAIDSEKWYERKPKLGNMKVFGCNTYAHIP